MLSALAMVFGYVEALIPFSFGVPGMKLGIANLVIVVSLYLLPISFLFGNMSMMMYSLAGGILSFLVMRFVKKTGIFSIIGVSICGGVSHNVGQLIMAVLAVQTIKLIYYFPMLLIGGLITGWLIGMLAQRILERIKSSSNV